MSKKEPSTAVDPEQLKLFPGFIAFGKDELNIAEFPIAALSNRIDSTQKTITYEDEITDQSTRLKVPRKLTITGSDLYGLPTSFDDEVILGLLNISRLQAFRDPEVTFTRHQIISVLGWSNQEYYYDRIKESINRWLGVTLYYQSAWRDKDDQEWKSGGFTLIDSVEWGKKGELSKIIWGNKVFSSFQQGNLKQLDLGLYRKLTTATARRIYRFLDKRMWNRSKLKFDLKKFAYNKIGLSQTAYKDVAQLKRQLRTGIKELEEIEFLMPCPDSERFRKVSRGMWDVYFERFSKARQADLAIEVDETPELESKLVGLGVGRTVAQRLLREFGDERIRERILWFEYLEAKKKTGGIKSVPKYLVHSIKDADFEKPDDYRSPDEKAAEKAQKAARAKKKAQADKEARKAEKSRQEASEREIEAAEAFYQTLSAVKQAEITESVRSGTALELSEKMLKMLVSHKVAGMLKSGELE